MAAWTASIERSAAISEMDVKVQNPCLRTKRCLTPRQMPRRVLAAEFDSAVAAFAARCQRPKIVRHLDQLINPSTSRQTKATELNLLKPQHGPSLSIPTVQFPRIIDFRGPAMFSKPLKPALPASHRDRISGSFKIARSYFDRRVLPVLPAATGIWRSPGTPAPLPLSRPTAAQALFGRS
jgi:hypothetical protein